MAKEVQSKVKEELYTDKTFHAPLSRRNHLTFGAYREVVPEEWHERAKKKGCNLITKDQFPEAKQAQKPKVEEVEITYLKEDLKKEKKGFLTDIMLARGFSRRDIEKKKGDLISQILKTNPIEDKVEIKEKSE